MKDNYSYRFDAILAVALEQDARQELAALPTPAALKELYPDTSSLDARITRALHTLHHPQKALHRALALCCWLPPCWQAPLPSAPKPATRCTLPSYAFCPLKCRSLILWMALHWIHCRKIIVTIMCRRGLCWMNPVNCVTPISFSVLITLPMIEFILLIASL